MIDLADNWLIFIAGIVLTVLGYLIKLLIKELQTLHSLIEENSMRNVPRETFNEFKQEVISALKSIIGIKETQIQHEEHLKNQDKVLEEIKTDLSLLKNKVFF